MKSFLRGWRVWFSLWLFHVEMLHHTLKQFFLSYQLDFQLADHLHLDTGLGGAPVIQLMLCG